ncbi:hypothetical protein BDV93DRAFT_265398 [Ceratobasidium sp. AG-I]|nr:hypothetical protein BDV93DRAFT_265398 [Ceratobasidium sp. AG-I]
MLADRKKRSVRFPSTDDPGDLTLVGGHATASASPASFYGTPATHFTGSPPPMVGHHMIRSSGRVGSALSFGSLPRYLYILTWSGTLKFLEFRLLHIPDSKVTSGVYTITNVTTGYRAILRSADIKPPLLTVSNELGAAKELLEDGNYAIINEQHPLYVSCDPKIKQGGTVYGDPEEKHWHIKASEDNYYSIWTTELDRNMAPLSWGLDDVENNASIVLRTGAHGTNNQWRIRPVTT